MFIGYILLGVPVYYLLKPKERNDYDDPQTGKDKYGRRSKIILMSFYDYIRKFGK